MLKVNRYGKKIRQLYNEVIKQQKAFYECPKCKKITLRRISYALWQCKKCGYKMAGAAYTPYSEAGEFLNKILENA
jgi:large subunit ribosomal protein L37Ae